MLSVDDRIIRRRDMQVAARHERHRKRSGLWRDADVPAEGLSRTHLYCDAALSNLGLLQRTLVLSPMLESIVLSDYRGTVRQLAQFLRTSAMPHLRTFSVSFARWKSSQAPLAPEELADGSSLRSLFLHDRIGGVVDDTGPFRPESLTALTHLNLDRSSLSLEAARALASVAEISLKQVEGGDLSLPSLAPRLIRYACSDVRGIDANFSELRAATALYSLDVTATRSVMNALPTVLVPLTQLKSLEIVGVREAFPLARALAVTPRSLATLVITFAQPFAGTGLLNDGIQLGISDHPHLHYVNSDDERFVDMVARRARLVTTSNDEFDRLPSVVRNRKLIAVRTRMVAALGDASRVPGTRASRLMPELWKLVLEQLPDSRFELFRSLWAFDTGRHSKPS